MCNDRRNKIGICERGHRLWIRIWIPVLPISQHIVCVLQKVVKKMREYVTLCGVGADFHVLVLFHQNKVASQKLKANLLLGKHSMRHVGGAL